GDLVRRVPGRNGTVRGELVCARRGESGGGVAGPFHPVVRTHAPVRGGGRRGAAFRRRGARVDAGGAGGLAGRRAGPVPLLAGATRAGRARLKGQGRFVIR